MRGASALQRVLAGAPDRDVRAIVVWERVLLTDRLAPRGRTAGILRDPRVTQYWDPGRALSRHLVAAAIAHPERVPEGYPMNEHTIIWDAVMLFSPDDEWDSLPPEPRFAGTPVIDMADSLATLLRGGAAP